MGLQGMINDMLQKCDFPTGMNMNGEVDHLTKKNPKAIAKLISCAENNENEFAEIRKKIHSITETKTIAHVPVLGNYRYRWCREIIIG